MKLMVCYDDSAAAGAALNLVSRRARALDAKIYVVTSIKGGADILRTEFVRVEKDLERIKAHIETQGLECEAKMSVRGLEPGEDLVQFVKEQNIDEILVGIKHRSKVGKFIFGSTAQYVILEAPSPVLTVK